MTIIYLKDGFSFGWGRGLGKGILRHPNGQYVALFCNKSPTCSGWPVVGLAYRNSKPVQG